ncbi:spore gernimation protein GerPA [Cohnella sp. CIP 111063]|uniref:spore germination protein n=1 Tax=unclassified Cohnella TaxID=2636738 RepID=UPI000B8C4D17|nr:MULTISPECIES: spore germination protein [unclassified Cohnella]OXS54937.1 spore gernimation protein GerPA [Cohnella sp. CIP 111063]
MPAIVGTFKIVSMGGSSILINGDSIQLAPQSTTKTFAGSGSFLTGDLARANNAISATNTNDPDFSDSDQNTAGNAGVI